MTHLVMFLGVGRWCCRSCQCSFKLQFDTHIGSKDVEVFLRSFYDGIRRDAEATAVTAELRRQRVIPELVETKIKRALDRKEGNGHLYDHLLSQATVKTLRIVCNVFIKEEGYPRMNELGERMKKELAHSQYVIENVSLMYTYMFFCTHCVCPGYHETDHTLYRGTCMPFQLHL